ncbi:MAG: NTP transferase domain-containing protein [Gemmatimonadetes bacterium]|nr:NTP transferase domain-containing protein [Gemmatimonadota bacterium]
MRTLVVLAAGLGRRFGGPKQLEPLGPHGESLLELTLHDAWSAGIGHAVLVTRAELEVPLRDRLQRGAARALALDFALQEVDAATGKPWGTAHAVSAAAPHVRGPFGVVNADDLYGRAALAALADSLAALRPGAPSAPVRGVLVAYPLDRTLSSNGGVSRGACVTDAAHRLLGIEETLGLEATPAGAVRGRRLDGTSVTLPGTTPVSLNLWGFEAGVLPLLAASFARFRERASAGEEHQLPTAVAEAVQSGQLVVTVRPTDAEWIGVTHPADAAPVRARLAEWFREGRYPASLFT